MTPAVIRTKLKQRPFRPLEMVLDNGHVVRVGSPEILVGEDAIVTLDRRGHVVMVAPEAVSMIRRANGAGRG